MGLIHTCDHKQVIAGGQLCNVDLQGFQEVLGDDRQTHPIVNRVGAIQGAQALQGDL